MIARMSPTVAAAFWALLTYFFPWLPAEPYCRLVIQGVITIGPCAQ